MFDWHPYHLTNETCSFSMYNMVKYTLGKKITVNIKIKGYGFERVLKIHTCVRNILKHTVSDNITEIEVMILNVYYKYYICFNLFLIVFNS